MSSSVAGYNIIDYILRRDPNYFYNIMIKAKFGHVASLCKKDIIITFLHICQKI